MLTARLPLDGSRQSPDTYLDTYTGTSDVTNRIFLLATAITSARAKGDIDMLIVADFDVPAAFLNEKLPLVKPLVVDNCTHAFLLIYLTKDMQLEVLGCMYGLKQSNSIFDKAFCNYLEAHDYSNLLSCYHTFVKYFNGYHMHVDDDLVINESQTLYDELKSILMIYQQAVVKLVSRGTLTALYP